MDVVCEACGELNADAGAFCTSCGAFLAWEDNAATEPTAEAPSVGRPNPPPAAPTAAVDDHPGGTASDPQPDAPAPPPARTAVLTPEPAGPGCPRCGLTNEPQRRFCAHCGEQIAALRVEVDRPQPDQAAIRRRDRTNRQAYARTLPALYRWGRPVLVIMVLAVLITLAIAAGTDPLGWGRARWADLRGTLVAAPGVQVTVVGGSDASQQQTGDPAALVDGTAAEWNLPWTVSGEAAGCGGAPGTATVELTLAQPTRIRAVEIRAGLGAGESDRPLQFRPKVVGIVVEDGACQSYPLADTAEPQRLDLDTGDPVSVIRIGVDSAYPAREDGQQRLSITEITLLTRPQ